MANLPTYLVTGGERGIGRGIAEELIDRGGAVVILGIDEGAAAKNLPALKERGPVRFIRGDVGDEEEVRAAVASIRETEGRLDGLVANAGIAEAHGSPLEELALGDWEKVLRTNLTGVFLCAKHTAALLRETRGAMVLISSTRALMSEPNTFAYAASKGGVQALTHSLAVSLGPEVRVNAIAPGWIHTGPPDDFASLHHEQHPVGRIGTPRDIASLAAFLLGPESGFITGQHFVADGGMTRKMIYAHEE